MAHNGAVRRLWALILISVKHLARRYGGQIPFSGKVWSGACPLGRGEEGEGRMGRGGQASGLRAGVAEGSVLGLLLHDQGNTKGLRLSFSCLPALDGDENIGQTRPGKGKWVGKAEKRVPVSWKPLPFTSHSEVWRRKAGCSSGSRGGSWGSQ